MTHLSTLAFRMDFSGSIVTASRQKFQSKLPAKMKKAASKSDAFNGPRLIQTETRDSREKNSAVRKTDLHRVTANCSINRIGSLE